MSKLYFFIALIAILINGKEVNRQQIFERVLQKYSSKSQCFSQYDFITEYIRELKKEVFPEKRDFEKKKVDEYMKKHNLHRVWKNLVKPQHNICTNKKEIAKQYQYGQNKTQITLNLKYNFETYPYLKHNIKHQRINDLMAVLPQIIKQELRMKRIIIFDKKMNVTNHPQNDSLWEYEKFIVPFIDDLPNIDMIIVMVNQLHHNRIRWHLMQNISTFQQFDMLLQQYKRIIIELPIFMLSKDLSQQMQFNKLPLVDIQNLEDFWNNRIRQVDEGKQIFKWQDKIQKAFYRTQVNGFPYDDSINITTNIPLYFTKLHLVNISRNNLDKIDAQFSGNQTYWSDRFIGTNLTLKEQIFPELSFKDMQKYKYLIGMDGWTPSKYKVPLVLHSNSVLFKQESPKVSWFFDQIQPYVHYVPIDRTMDNILTQVDFIRKNDALAKQIVNNAQKFFQDHLTLKAAKKQLFNILKQYGQIQNYNLSFFQKILYKQFNIDDEIERNKIELAIISFILIVIISLTSYILVRNKHTKQYFHNFTEKILYKFFKKNRIFAEEFETSQIKIKQ